MAPGRCPRAHSLSSRTSTSVNFSPVSIRLFTAATFVSLTCLFASFTKARNFAACAMQFSPIRSSFQPTIAPGKQSSARFLRLIVEFCVCVWDGSAGRPLTSRSSCVRANLRLRRLLRTLLCKGTNQHHQIPAYLFGGAISLAPGHFPAPVGHDVKQFPVGHFCDRTGIAPIVQV